MVLLKEIADVVGHYSDRPVESTGSTYTVGHKSGGRVCTLWMYDGVVMWDIHGDYAASTQNNPSIISGAGINPLMDALRANGMVEVGAFREFFV